VPDCGYHANYTLRLDYAENSNRTRDQDIDKVYNMKAEYGND